MISQIKQCLHCNKTKIARISYFIDQNDDSLIFILSNRMQIMSMDQWG